MPSQATLWFLWKIFGIEDYLSYLQEEELGRQNGQIFSQKDADDSQSGGKAQGQHHHEQTSRERKDLNSLTSHLKIFFSKTKIQAINIY